MWSLNQHHNKASLLSSLHFITFHLSVCLHCDVKMLFMLYQSEWFFDKLSTSLPENKDMSDADNECTWNIARMQDTWRTRACKQKHLNQCLYLYTLLLIVNTMSDHCLVCCQSFLIQMALHTMQCLSLHLSFLIQVFFHIRTPKLSSIICHELLLPFFPSKSPIVISVFFISWLAWIMWNVFSYYD